jgi:hypothetical protein
MNKGRKGLKMRLFLALDRCKIVQYNGARLEV